MPLSNKKQRDYDRNIRFQGDRFLEKQKYLRDLMCSDVVTPQDLCYILSNGMDFISGPDKRYNDIVHKYSQDVPILELQTVSPSGVEELNDDFSDDDDYDFEDEYFLSSSVFLNEETGSAAFLPESDIIELVDPGSTASDSNEKIENNSSLYYVEDLNTNVKQDLLPTIDLDIIPCPSRISTIISSVTSLPPELQEEITDNLNCVEKCLVRAYAQQLQVEVDIKMCRPPAPNIIGRIDYRCRSYAIQDMRLRRIKDELRSYQSWSKLRISNSASNPGLVISCPKNHGDCICNTLVGRNPHLLLSRKFRRRLKQVSNFIMLSRDYDYPEIFFKRKK